MSAVSPNRSGPASRRGVSSSSVAVGADPHRLAVRPRGDDLVELVAAEQQRDAVVGGVAGRDRAVGDRRAADGQTRGLAVHVHGQRPRAGSRAPATGAGEPKRRRDAPLEPAHRARRQTRRGSRRTPSTRAGSCRARARARRRAARASSRRRRRRCPARAASRAAGSAGCRAGTARCASPRSRASRRWHETAGSAPRRRRRRWGAGRSSALSRSPARARNRRGRGSPAPS